MDWNGGTNLKTFVSRPAESPFSFLYNCNYDQYPGMEVKHPAMSMSTETLHGMVQVTDKSIDYGALMNMEKKKRLTTDQLESLERSFLEEIKLDPVRKMKLSRELGLQPRQVAVWFQNRRARWKAKQLERLYDGLKQEFDAISTEKQRLQEEVLKLKSMLRDQGMAMKKKGRSTGEETVESTSELIRSNSANTIKPRATTNHHQQIAECNYLFNMEDFNNPSNIPVTPQPYWAGAPILPPPFQ